MSSVSDFYPKDGVLAGAAMVVVAISITTAMSLLISMFFERRPTVRHAVLASALFCSLATPLIAILIRTSGTSTFAWNLLPAAQAAEVQSHKRARLAAGESTRRAVSSGLVYRRPMPAENFRLGRWLASLVGSETGSPAARSLPTSPAARRRITVRRMSRQTLPAATGADGSTSTAGAAGREEAIRHWISPGDDRLAGWCGDVVGCGSCWAASKSGVSADRAKPFLADSRGTIATHLRALPGHAAPAGDPDLRRGPSRPSPRACFAAP